MVGGFRVERLLGTGSVGAVYEATQLSLGRTVALRLIAAEELGGQDGLARFDEQQRALGAIHHPNLVATYAIGEWEGGRYVATRRIRGTTLATLLEEGLAPQASAIEPLHDAVRVAHGTGVVHGSISADNILVEESGTCCISDFGLGRSGTREGDLDALAAVTDAVRVTTAASGTARRTRRFAIAGVGACAAIGLGAFFLLGDDSDRAASPVSSPVAGTRVLGSSLGGDASTLVGCSEALSTNTPGCTLMQARLPRHQLTASQRGVIRRWVVRGGSGIVALQVIREGKGDRSFVAGFAQPQNLVGAGPHEFDAEVGVRPGDRIGIHLDPGAAIGSREGVSDALVTKWDGVLTADARPSTGEIRETELMFRAEVDYGAQPRGPDRIAGEAAAQAPQGTEFTDGSIELPVSGGVRVLMAEVDGSVVIDVFGGGTRLSRTAVPDADPAGQFLEISESCGPVVPGGFCVRWGNPGQPTPLEHQYIVRSDGRVKFVS